VARHAPSALDPSVARLSLTTSSAAQTRELAAMLAAEARPGHRLALIGPLGAGKTQFAKGFAVGLGVVEVVNSPSFTLMAEYRGRLPLFHQDLYRLSDAESALDSGLLDVRQDEGVTLTEWAERLPSALDRFRLDVLFTVLGEDERGLELVAHAPAYEPYLGAAARSSMSERRPAPAGRVSGR
jgi:tRNA threonylcarbamoyladenosine biosynthesis protein TsaE